MLLAHPNRLPACPQSHGRRTPQHSAQSDAQLRAEVLAQRHQLRVLERKLGKRQVSLVWKMLAASRIQEDLILASCQELA